MALTSKPLASRLLPTCVVSWAGAGWVGLSLLGGCSTAKPSGSTAVAAPSGGPQSPGGEGQSAGQDASSSRGGRQGDLISLQSVNYPEKFIRFNNLFGELQAINTSEDRSDASFRIIKPGFAGAGTVSLESVNHPGHFFCQDNFRIKISMNEGSSTFSQDASFRAVPGLADPHQISFQSVNYPSRYIRHRDFHLFLEAGNDRLFRNDVTFHYHPVLSHLLPE